MSDEYTGFFSEEYNREAIKGFLQRFSRLSFNDDMSNNMLRSVLTVLRGMYNDYEEWGEKCQYNVDQVGSRFIDLLSAPEISRPVLEDVFILSFRFLCEYEFWTESGEFGNDLEVILNNVRDRLDDFDEKVKTKLGFAINFMPSRIVKRLVNDPKVSIYREFLGEKRNIEEFVSSWDSDVNRLIERCNQLTANLKKHEMAFNFVGLYKGFSELCENKKKESKGLWRWVKLMALSIFIPIIIEATYLWVESPAIDFNHLFFVAPLASSIIILLYYLRVFLREYNSVRAQIIQIELRMTLCQFIQDYAEYAREIKTNDEEALSKFENVIFSGLMADTDKLPSTFDGVEQLASLVKAMKSSR